MKGLKRSVWGLAGPYLWAGGHQPPPQRQRDNLDPGGFLYVENIDQCSVHKTETTLGVQSRKGFNAEN